VRASALSAIAAGLLGTVALTIMVTSGPSELVISASARSPGSQPGRATELHEWDAGRIEGLDHHLRRQEKLSDMNLEVIPPRPRLADTFSCRLPLVEEHPHVCFLGSSRAGG